MQRIGVLCFLIFILFWSCEPKETEAMIQDRLDNARKYGLEENYEKAIQIIDDVIADYPDYPGSYVLGASYMSVQPNLRQEAIKYLNKAININPNDYEAYLLRGQIKTGYEGLIDLNKAIDLNPLDAGIFYARGQQKTQLNNYYGALDDFHKALELDNFRSVEIKSSLYGDIALAKIQLSEYSEALEEIDKAILLNSLDPTIYYVRYIYYSKIGELELAKEDLKNAEMLGLIEIMDVVGINSIPKFELKQ
ncbi:hypothetical protein SYJ56_15800 [Algoriphagus sp. D3-2-R+10]|uniref:tetratricopeptide repeat protein n=1 Tax=Algoriphagus aurantiacus TaxID=3103948 RepID=UPI002B3AB036|nr:hypothetical protein [Algoriphagus sp. D3-2-R+10]MEB2776790.1 hypothetical protein [Algoriphagus sp. D3-2-R+10]